MRISPLVVEFSGMPKSGKDKILGIMEHFFRRSGYKVKVLRESARMCPFDKAFHTEYTLWGFHSMLNHLLEELFFSGKRADIVFMNRGVFDSLALIKFLHTRRELSDDEYCHARDYITKMRWHSFVDVVYLFKTPPEISLQREYGDKLIHKEGRIMNVEALTKMALAYESTFSEHKTLFRNAVVIDTCEVSVRERASRIRDHILNLISQQLQTGDGQEKVFDDLYELRTVVSSLQQMGCKIVLVKGVYDLLHTGHLEFFEKAKKYGDCLVVAVLRDEATTIEKGNARPLNIETERARLLAALSIVDFVTFMERDEPMELIGILRPDYFVTTSECYVEQVDGTITVKILRSRENSSTKIIEHYTE